MSQNPSTFLDAILMKIVQAAGTIVPVRSALNFLGPSFTLVDNQGNDSTDVSIANVPQAATINLAVLAGNVPVSLAQQAAGYLILVGAPAANIVLQWPSPTLGQRQTVDATGVTFGGHNITLQANPGAHNWSTVLGASGLWRIEYNGTQFYGNAITP